MTDDAETILGLQNASLRKPDFGLQITHGLIGSPEWWKQIRSQALPTHTLRGTISSLSMGAHGDYPLCYVESETGEMSQWTRMADTPLYAVGNRIEVDYVVQLLKPIVVQRWKTKPEQKIVTEVRLQAV